jgi:hypothetical protein
VVVNVGAGREEAAVTEDVGSITGVGHERGGEVGRLTGLVPKVVCVLRLNECLGHSRKGGGPRQRSGDDRTSGGSIRISCYGSEQSARFYGSPIVVEFSFLVEVGEVISREVVAVHSVVGNSSVAIDLQTSSTCLSLTLVVIGNVIGILFKEKKSETR